MTGAISVITTLSHTVFMDGLTASVSPITFLQPGNEGNQTCKVLPSRALAEDRGPLSSDYGKRSVSHSYVLAAIRCWDNWRYTRILDTWSNSNCEIYRLIIAQVMIDVPASQSVSFD